VVQLLLTVSLQAVWAADDKLFHMELVLFRLTEGRLELLIISVIFSVYCTVWRMLSDFVRPHSPHSAHILPPDSPVSQQLQQDRQL